MTVALFLFLLALPQLAHAADDRPCCHVMDELKQMRQCATDADCAESPICGIYINKERVADAEKAFAGRKDCAEACLKFSEYVCHKGQCEGRYALSFPKEKKK